MQHFIDPEYLERRTNRIARAAVFPIHHSRRYYAVRLVVRLLTMFLIVAFFVALTSQWGMTPR